MEHNKIISNLESRLKKWGYDVYVNQEYDFVNGLKHKVGECDLYAVKDKNGKDASLIIIEVKRTDSEKNRIKAEFQLYKDYLWLSDIRKLYRPKEGLFYAYGFGDNYKIERVKWK